MADKPRPPTSPFGHRVPMPTVAESAHHELHQDIDFRLGQIEKTERAIEERLQAGAGALAALRDSVTQVIERTKPIPPWMLVSIVLAIVGVISGAVATFYTRTDDARREAAVAQRAVEEKMHQLQLEQTSVKGNLDQIKKSVDRTEKLVDDLSRVRPARNGVRP